MKPRKAVGLGVTACVLALALSYLPIANSKTTDTSDIWWIHSESGWGIQFVQNNNTIFATLFVYGPDNQPTWYSATLNYQGSFNWSGTLYKTTGPWFGAGSFDPSAVTATPVGNMSFNFPTVSTGTLIYSVNGVPVLKTIERQLLVYEDFSGNYAGVMGQQGTGLACRPADNFESTSATVQITQSSTAMTIVTMANGDTCTFPGTYSQRGHFGRLIGSYLCASGASGTFDFYEMIRNFSDFRAITKITPSVDCTLKGYLIGLKQPLVP